MDRKKALGIAASATFVGVSAVVAAGSAFGLFGFAAGDDTVRLQPTSSEATTTTAEQEPVEVTEVVDVPVEVPVPAAAGTVAVPPVPGDVSGPCDEDEHADDPECTGAVAGSSTEDDDDHSASYEDHDDEDDDHREDHDEDEHEDEHGEDHDEDEHESEDD